MSSYVIKAWLGDLLDKRKKQISTTKGVTETLAARAMGRCPETMVKFLLVAYSDNMKRTEKLDKCSPMDFRDVLKKQLEEVDVEIRNMKYVADCTENVCAGIEALIRKKFPRS